MYKSCSTLFLLTHRGRFAIWRNSEGVNKDATALESDEDVDYRGKE
jgi:hypothetical protein